MFEDLRIIHWPDPRLKKISEPVRECNAALKALAARMVELMREAKGVGLAAPQVGKNLRMFVMNPTGEDQDLRVYVNPILTDVDGQEECEEGCLSLPGVNIKVLRAKTVRLDAMDLDGKSVTQTETGYVARIWQHEFDHLNGVLLVDRMGPATRLLNRKVLKEMEETYTAEHPPVKRAKQRVR